MRHLSRETVNPWYRLPYLRTADRCEGNVLDTSPKNPCSTAKNRLGMPIWAK
jgi:hypothetical protein